MQGTVDAIQTRADHRRLRRRGTATDESVDGLPPGEGVFLPCTFWLADNLALMGRVDEARALFERLVGLANDVGLLAEEYDPVAKRQLGNFPQAFTHVALVNGAVQPLEHRPRRLRPGQRSPLALALTRPLLDHRRLPPSRETGDDVELDRRPGRDPARPVGDGRCVERERRAVVRLDLPDPAAFVEGTDGAVPMGGQCTILAIGSSMMPVAPCSFSAGMSVLISALATTVSTA